MVDFKRILAPVDMSDFSLQALDYAVEMAQKYGAELTVLSVVNGSFYTNTYMNVLDLENIVDSVHQQVEKNLREVVQKYDQSPVTIKTVVEEGNPYLAICEYAKKKHIDLIIMASHGYSGLDSILIGSVTEKVVRKATCPVLTLKFTSE
ncbi:UspA domain-containing protein [Desulfurispirillum indicum S5]|uniref:Universal stress protein n=1 Tax=Desulfurispirillum indicum (strain ATCC BAA-1389 / DSM 22839 / S5) TaxID=653733 RepID=E6W1L9_DESIS|nr:universal stress protein [Desulfurispirillum indicum]ADU66568.1 UspA domain-containing protein [Desulfurispirillum indicum S5]